MDPHQLSESIAESETTCYPADHDETAILGERGAGKTINGPKVNGEIKNEESPLENGWRAAAESPDSEWASTSDTSIHSSPSIPAEVLEYCNGLDDASFTSVSPEVPAPQLGRGRGRGQTARRGRKSNRRGRGTRGRNPMPSENSSSDDSNSSSSVDTSSSSIDSETGSSPCSGSCSHSSCNSYSSSEGSSRSCSACSFTSCDCSCHSDETATSFESLDDLTSMPRAKRRDARLGQKGIRKVANQCQQS